MTKKQEGITGRLEEATLAYWRGEARRQEHGYARLLDHFYRKGAITRAQLNGHESPHTVLQAYILDRGDIE